ncbi:MAG TPA: peptidoglycan-binding domain-containing protein [Phormidium sp.]
MNYVNKNPISENNQNQFTLFDSTVLDKVQEYCKLAVRQTLSDSEAQRMLEILEEAESDSRLEFWIDEADHFLAHELNLTDENSINDYENQLAWLREYIDASVILDKDILSPSWNQELSPLIEMLTKEVQQHLKNRGFDPGPIDGIFGERTQTAIKKFQAAHQLEADGVLKKETREALGLL